jgi:4'-phosphopantetheinyl transferase N-terminal domain
MEAVHLSIHTLPALAAREELLSEAERAQVATLGLRGRRRNEWIRGRLAARRALISRFGETATHLSLLTEEDGAPRLEGKTDSAVSLSHDGDYFAVAIADRGVRRVAVDICLQQHEARLQRIFSRLDVRGLKLDVVAGWAALECFLKLRRLGVAALLDTALTLALSTDGVRVSALGSTASFSLFRQPQFVVAWGGEPA